MAKTCLQIVQQACGRLGLNQPTAVVSSTDPAVLQYLSLLNEEGEELADRYQWQALTLEASFTTVAQENQGNLDTIAPGWRSIINNTIWNFTLRRRVFGPRSQQQWEQIKAMYTQTLWNQYKIQGNQLLFVADPAAGELCKFQYVSKNWATDAAGTTTKDSFTADSDLPVLDDNLMILGLIWRWRKAKGLDFSAEYKQWDDKANLTYGRDGTKPTLNIGIRGYTMPGLYIPEGNWPA